jgi:hypothetical protein
MTNSAFVPTLRQQISVSFAYLAYIGEELAGNDPTRTAEQILHRMKATMSDIKPLHKDGQLDWEIVWGPAVYTFHLPDAKFQDNMMYVAQQKSDPSNYVVGIRGTNSHAIWDFIVEDLLVLHKIPWTMPEGVVAEGQPTISQSTQDGLNVLLYDLVPMQGIPGFGHSITAFLNDRAALGKINVLFTGHSLGGALAPTLALWFKQSQNIPGNWDPNGNATISTVPFAGPTVGNADFAKLFDQQLGNACERIHNTLDIVPHAWEIKQLKELPDLYHPTINMPLDLRLLLDGLELIASGYTQVNTSLPITWTIQPTEPGGFLPDYLKQVIVQHNSSYPTLMQVTELMTTPEHLHIRKPKQSLSIL